jgi:hypothetical protein
MNNITQSLENARRTDPLIPVGHPQFVWRSHADVDVQRTWRQYGWAPPSELREESDKNFTMAID